MNRVTAADFDRIYAADCDPWKHASSDYETRKHAATLAELRSVVYPRALEIGCAAGVFTARLAPRCTRVLAIDFSSRAVAMARRRVGALRDVEVRRASFPEQVPPGPWSLVVCSEVLYYLDPPALDRAVAWFADELAHGASVVAVHWRGPGRTEPLRGDDVHNRLRVDLAQWHSHDARRPRYRLDRFEGDRETGGEAPWVADPVDAWRIAAPGGGAR